MFITMLNILFCQNDLHGANVQLSQPHNSERCRQGQQIQSMDAGTQNRPSKTLISRKTLLAMIPLSDRAIFNMEKRGDFPRRIVLTSRNVAWDLAEVEDWIESRKESEDPAHRPGFTAAS